MEPKVGPFAATSRWPHLVALMQRMDALRFANPEPTLRAGTGEVIADAIEFVRSTIPHAESR